MATATPEHLLWYTPSMNEETDKQKSFWTVKKSEYEWVKTIDAFSLKVAPDWFDFVGKLLMLGALKYLKNQGNNWFVAAIYVLSLAFFYLYLQSLLYRFPFDRFLPGVLIKHNRFASIFSLAVAGLLLLTINYTLNSAVAALATK